MVRREGEAGAEGAMAGRCSGRGCLDVVAVVMAPSLKVRAGRRKR
jgi:hypothetical protein